MMQLKGLKRAIKKLAKGKHHTVRHGVTEYKDGQIKDVWEAYIEDTSWTKDCNTPEEVVAEMEWILKGG